MCGVSISTCRRPPNHYLCFIILKYPRLFPLQQPVSENCMIKKLTVKSLNYLKWQGKNSLIVLLFLFFILKILDLWSVDWLNWNQQKSPNPQWRLIILCTLKIKTVTSTYLNIMFYISGNLLNAARANPSSTWPSARLAQPTPSHWFYIKHQSEKCPLVVKKGGSRSVTNDILFKKLCNFKKRDWRSG